MLPLQCTLCHAAADRLALCAGCRADIERLRLANPCELCGQADAAPVCSSCSKKPPPLHRLIVGYTYRPPLDTLIVKFKYSGHWWLSKTLAQLTTAPPQVDYAVPIPLHYSRQRQRGFNQAHELAKKMQLPLTAGLLTRTVNTVPQATLAAAERQRNMRGAFQAAAAVKHKSVLLVDDVMTTGATLYEAARTLKKAGAEKVDALLIARAVL